MGLFSKKKKNTASSDIDELKKRFSSVSGGGTSQATHSPQVQAPSQPQPVAAPQAPPVQPEVHQQQTPVQTGNGVSQEQPRSQPQVNVVEMQGDKEVPAQDDSKFEEVILSQDTKKEDAKSEEDEVSKKSIASYLTEIKENYEDAKLISLVIQQIKELIEIDNNLNSKMGDLEVQIKRESAEREKVMEKVDKHYKELQELAKNMDKFVALYELVTNQFNPFLEGQGKPGEIKKLDAMNVSKHGENKKSGPEEKKEEGQTESQVLFNKIKEKVQGETEEVKPAVEDNSGKPAEDQKDEEKKVEEKKGGPIQTKKLPEHLHFQLKDGSRIDSLSGLLQWLKDTDDEALKEYVTHYKNDFSGWIYNTFHNEFLSKKLSESKSREEMINVLSEYINTHH